MYAKAEKLTATKRNVLKSIASIFDPVGYLQNIVESLKILFQKIWVSNVGWDDVINCDLQCQDLEFKRHYFSEHVNDPIVHIYLHGFSDASEVAYAACIYLKYITKMGDIGIKFLTAKSRIVSARKAFTVPQLELLGNFILAKLMSSVKGALCDEMVINDIFCHTDSMITLAWIQPGKKLKPFEETRVKKLEKM